MQDAASAIQEQDHGNRQVEPENLHRFGSSKSHRDLRGSHPQLRQEPPSGVHRARRGSSRGTRGPMAVQLVGFDGTGNAIPEVHALKASAGQAHRGADRFVAAFSYSWLEYFAVRLQAFFRVSIS